MYSMRVAYHSNPLYVQLPLLQDSFLACKLKLPMNDTIPQKDFGVK